MKFSILKAVFIVAVTSFLAACSSTNYMVHQIDAGTEGNKEKISLKDNSFHLVNGGDGIKTTLILLQEKPAEGSGASALNIANEYLAKHTQAIVAEKEILTTEQALEAAVSNNSGYLVYSQVEIWTDPLGINCTKHYYDQASVLLSIYSLSDKALISTSRLSAKSCPHTVNGIPVTTGSPEKLFETLFDKWFNENFTL